MVQMTQTERRGISASQKQELWERWKRGQSMNDIARALAKQRGSIHFVLSTNGGIQPSARRRSRLALSLLEREEISLFARQVIRLFRDPDLRVRLGDAGREFVVSRFDWSRVGADLYGAYEAAIEATS